ncbi:hypothetical protein AN394_04213 [Pseudoalteromonas sp. P1-26]|uniref:hypothetical protein n=1 Tax=Pseudoalteromonas sp. P1-26 TaxID=1723759 RepID=UPI0006D68E80|nr:hypothetical protein [Pseudoalteromonas sp. P1-26]KPZ65264.1 hypothetical protein AN394_04213 [Pseudoalteromonas sp. P1-26]
MDIFSLAVGFVVGGFTGAAGTFYGNMFTDQRREQEKTDAERVQWETLKRKFPAIIQEMTKDVNNPEFAGVRTFFVKSSRSAVNSSEPYFEYHTDVHLDLQAAILYMQDIGYIQDITPKNCPKFRFYEHFYELLKNA